MSLKEKIESKKFVILGEFEPPKGNYFSPMLKWANPVRGRLDAIVVPEMASAVMKASSLGASAYLQREGIETIFQVCCRDRNRLALQADILSASALGIKNIMVIQGEDIRFGDHPGAREVNDLNIIELLEAINTLQRGKDLSGIELKGTPEFFVGSSINTGATGGLLDIELENLEKMIELGVRYVITNPIFDIRRFEQFLKRIDTSQVAVIVRILLLKSAGMARYIDRNIKDISIPPDIIRDIQKAPDKVKKCVEIASQLILRIKDMGLPGVLISTVGWEDKLPMILDRI